MKKPYKQNPFEFSGGKNKISTEPVLEKNYDNEWEEVLVENGAAEPQKIRPLFNLEKFKWLASLVALIIFVLVGRMFHLQIVLGKVFEKEAEENRYRIQVLQAPRGVIYDSNKELLVSNAPVFDLVIIPGDFPSKKEEEKINDIYERLRNFTDINRQEFKDKVDSLNALSYDPIIIQENIPRDIALKIESELIHLQGVQVEKSPVRKYYEPEAFSHILGYIGRINEKEVQEKKDKGELYLPNDKVGKNGLEFSYEDILSGEYGKRQVEVDSRGKVMKILAKEDPIAGDDIVLTIDKDFQLYAKSVLEETAKKAGTTKASAVAIDPRNGEIRLMVTIPSYDNNLFTQGISTENYNKLLQDEDKPLLNRAVNGIYPPGSIVKPLVAVAGLEEGVVDQNTVINDEGKIYVPNQYNSDIVYEFVGWNLDGLGPMNVFSAIARSSDIYFYYLGGGFEEFVGLGIEKLRRYYEKFLFGSKTGIDLPSEAEGLIPSPEWKEKQKGEVWYLGDTYNLSIGQGDLLITPLQAAVSTSSIANGGTIYKPHMVSKSIKNIPNQNPDIREFKSQIIKENFVSRQNVEISRRAMRQTVEDGSGRALQALPVSSGGKTGTAQFANNTKTHAWFTAFAPYDEPEIALAVIVEGGGEGQEVAAPAARDILKWYFENKE